MYLLSLIHISTEMGGYGMEALRLDELDIIKSARTAVEQTVASLGGRQLATWSYTIMIEPETAASLVDVIGGLFCASDVHRGRSMMKGRLGELVASPCVNPGSYTHLDVYKRQAHHSAGHEILFRSKRAHRNDGEPIH